MPVYQHQPTNRLYRLLLPFGSLIFCNFTGSTGHSNGMLPEFPFIQSISVQWPVHNTSNRRRKNHISYSLLAKNHDSLVYGSNRMAKTIISRIRPA